MKQTNKQIHACFPLDLTDAGVEEEEEAAASDGKRSAAPDWPDDDWWGDVSDHAPDVDVPWP